MELTFKNPITYILLWKVKPLLRPPNPRKITEHMSCVSCGSGLKTQGEIGLRHKDLYFICVLSLILRSLSNRSKFYVRIDAFSASFNCHSCHKDSEWISSNSALTLIFGLSIKNSSLNVYIFLSASAADTF